MDSFPITCTSLKGNQNTFHVFDEGVNLEFDKRVHEFTIRVTDDLNSPDAAHIMELKLVEIAEGEWRIDQINHHETKQHAIKRFRGKCIPNELLPVIARRLSIIIRSSPPMSQATDGTAVWRTPDATRMWGSLSDHLDAIGSDYHVEHITSDAQNVYRLVKRTEIPNGG